MTARTPYPPRTAIEAGPSGPGEAPLSGKGFLLYVSRLFAVPAALMAVAALLAGLAPAVPQRGVVIDVVLNHGRGRAVTPYELVVAHPSDPTQNVHVDVDRALGERVVTGDSAVVQATPVSGFPRSVVVYRDGRALGSSSRASVFSWGAPLFLLAIAGTTLSPLGGDMELRVVLAGALFNVGGGVWGLVTAIGAITR